MTIIVKGASITAMQAQRTQQPGGPLNRKPQADWAYSCLRSPAIGTSRTTIKHATKNLQRNNKKCSHMTLAPCVTQATLAGRATHTIDWCHPERRQNKHTLQQQQQRHKLPSSFWHKIEDRVCCCGSLLKPDHQQPSRVKRAKRKRCFLHFWTTISNFTDIISMGLNSMDADLKIGLMTSRIRSILTNDGPPLVELVKVPRVQNILKLYNTNQDYTIVNNCLAWKQQTMMV